VNRLAVALALAFACGPSAPTPPAVAPSAPEPGAPELPGEPAPEPSAVQRKVQKTADEIVAAVGAARELSVTRGVEVEMIDRPGVRDFVRTALYEDMTPEELRLLTRIEASMGVLPVGSDGEQVLLDLYESGVLGIYDPDRKILLIGDFVDTSTLGHVIGHEIAHGLQDMHFDLERLQEPVKGRSDFDAARTFLVEGDAEAAYLAYVHRDEGIAGVSSAILRILSDRTLGVDERLTPYPILARMLQMPYGDGTATVVALAQARGFAAIDALYGDLPTTTEQMLHVDKLEAREPPRPIVIDRAPLLAAFPDHDVVWEDELGEAALLAMLAEVMGTERARAAAAGWGGDRFLALDRRVAPDAAPVLVGAIVWDRTADAAEFEPGFRAYLERQKPGDHVVVRKDARVVFATQLAGTDPRVVGKAGLAALREGKR
jgi:hypothetical protein